VIPRKGLLFALQALSRLLPGFPQLELRVAGETLAMPSFLATCRSFIEAHGLGRHVRFLDNLGIPQLADEYAACSLMLLPSMQETAPVVIAEAMAAGAPIVATRVGGVPHMVEDGMTGLLVDYGDVDGLVAALSRLLSDSALRSTLVQRGRAQAEQRFRLPTVASRTRRVYEQVLQASGSRQRGRSQTGAMA
jgi:glycosyltransferase involved in cell wall biosynthesis